MKKTILCIGFFLFLGAAFIISNHNLHLNVHDELRIFSQAYLGWFATLATHGVHITGYVVHSEWLPGAENASANLTDAFKR